MISKNVCIMALAGLLHDIGKFADRGDFFVSPEFKRRHQGLYQPTKKGNFTHKHALYTAAFIEELESCFPKDFLQSQEIQEPLINLAASHHKPETPLQKIITVADRLSSGFDRNEFESPHKGIPYRDYKKTRMISLFEKLNFENPDRTEDGSPDAYNYKYQLQALSPKSIFPTKDASYSKQDYEILLESFIKALKSL